MPDIELPEELVGRLADLPHGPTGPKARALVERAINNALDTLGWPAGERGEVSVPADHWFVNIWDRRGKLLGHVGPIHGPDAAQRTAASWRLAKYSAIHMRRSLGRSMTNDHLAA